MGRIIKWVLILGVLGLLGVLGYSVFGDLSAPQSETTREVILDVD